MRRIDLRNRTSQVPAWETPPPLAALLRRRGETFGEWCSSRSVSPIDFDAVSDAAEADGCASVSLCEWEGFAGHLRGCLKGPEVVLSLNEIEHEPSKQESCTSDPFCGNDSGVVVAMSAAKKFKKSKLSGQKLRSEVDPSTEPEDEVS